MHRGDGEPYNPYPEEEEPRREHHHHLFGHHHSEERPEYGSNTEHRPPPPSRQDYGEGPYGQGQQHGGYDDVKHSSQYPPGQDPASGHGYGGQSYHTSPYAPAPAHIEQGQAPPRRHVPGLPVRLHCKENPDFSLTVVPGRGPVMVPTNLNDDYQVWYKDETVGTRVKDETGSSAFCLINKVTGQALRHPHEDLQQCLLAQYEPNGHDESLWWTLSEDMGHGYRCVRMANAVTRNLDVLRGDKKSGGVKEGAPVITFAWKKQDNQIWKLTPA